MLVYKLAVLIWWRAWAWWHDVCPYHAVYRDTTYNINPYAGRMYTCKLCGEAAKIAKYIKTKQRNRRLEWFRQHIRYVGPVV